MLLFEQPSTTLLLQLLQSVHTITGAVAVREGQWDANEQPWKQGMAEGRSHAQLW
jgi:hypothetical protein